MVLRTIRARVADVGPVRAPQDLVDAPPRRRGRRPRHGDPLDALVAGREPCVRAAARALVLGQVERFDGVGRGSRRSSESVRDPGDVLGVGQPARRAPCRRRARRPAPTRCRCTVGPLHRRRGRAPASGRRGRTREGAAASAACTAPSRIQTRRPSVRAPRANEQRDRLVVLDEHAGALQHAERLRSASASMSAGVNISSEPVVRAAPRGPRRSRRPGSKPSTTASMRAATSAGERRWFVLRQELRRALRRAFSRRMSSPPSSCQRTRPCTVDDGRAPLGGAHVPLGVLVAEEVAAGADLAHHVQRPASPRSPRRRRRSGRFSEMNSSMSTTSSSEAVMPKSM